MSLLRLFADLCPCHEPDAEPYQTICGAVESSEAFAKAPALIIRPRNQEELRAVVRRAAREGAPLAVKGGSHSHVCAAAGAVMLDLGGLRKASFRGGVVVAEGGALMGDLLAACPDGQVIPIGAAHTPGFGLATHGGIGALSRRYGLTLDQLVSATVLTGSGECLEVNGHSTGDEADLWWGLRGAASCLGVVAEASFRVHELPKIRSRVIKLNLEALAAYGKHAPRLSKIVSASAVISRTSQETDPSLIIYVVYMTEMPDAIAAGDEVISELLAESGSPVRWECDEWIKYYDSPPMAMPNDDGSSDLPWSPGDPAERRLRSYKKTLFVSELPEGIADSLAECLRAAPTPYCRIDFQQAGGEVSHVSRDECAFWNRDFEWSITIIGGWPWGGPEGAAVQQWVWRVRKLLMPVYVGNYVVENVPGDPYYGLETAGAYGEHLPRLRQIKQRWDPAHVFRYGFLRFDSMT